MTGKREPYDEKVNREDDLHREIQRRRDLYKGTTQDEFDRAASGDVPQPPTTTELPSGRRGGRK